MSEIEFSGFDEAQYMPHGDFQYDIVSALDFAYKRALETDSLPIVACLEKLYNISVIPLSKVRFMGVANKDGLDELIKVYLEVSDSIPPHNLYQGAKEELEIFFQMLLEAYLSKKTNENIERNG